MRYIVSYLDFLGISASFLCAVHCLALPIAMAFGLAGGMTWLENPVIEWTFFGSAFVMAGWSLSGSYRYHRNLRPALLAVAGFAILVGVHLLEGRVSHGWAALGGVAIAYAHYVNWQLSQVCAR